MMLNTLAPTFSPKARPKPYSLGQPTSNQDPECLEPTQAPINPTNTPPPAIGSLQLEE